jgi:hypothetical protein
MNRLRVASPFDVGKMAEDMLHGLAVLRREEAMALTPRATNHEAPAEFDQAKAHTRGVIHAASHLQLAFERLTGDILTRAESTRLAEGVVGAYISELQKAAVRS